MKLHITFLLATSWPQHVVLFSCSETSETSQDVEEMHGNAICGSEGTLILRCR